MGDVVPVISAQEHWNEYLLDDGSVMKIKLVLTEVVKVPGQFDVKGCPMYGYETNTVMTVLVPEDKLAPEGGATT
jgi:hypothetical protein